MSGFIQVDYQQGELPEGIYDGSPFVAELSYETATVDSFPEDPQRGLYQTEVGPSNFLSLHAGPAKILANDLRLWVGNDIEGSPQIGDGRPIWEFPDDAFQMLTTPITTNFPLPPFNSIVFEWRDPTRTALVSDALPRVLDLENFQDTWFKITAISLNSGDSQFTFRGIVVDIARVPEPSAWHLIVPMAMLLVSRKGSTAGKASNSKFQS